MVVETNSSILCQMEVLEDETVKKDTSADIWTNASRFYYNIGEMKDTLMPTIVKYFEFLLVTSLPRSLRYVMKLHQDMKL